VSAQHSSGYRSPPLHGYAAQHSRSARHRHPRRFPRALVPGFFAVLPLLAIVAVLLPGPALAAPQLPWHALHAPGGSGGSIALASAQPDPVSPVRARPGDTLSAIAARVLHSPRRWPVLWWDNRGAISNPNVLRAGTVLRFGTWHRVRPWLARRAAAALPVPQPAPAAASPPGAVSATSSAYSGTYSGGSGFQACVISRESGGNPGAVNPSSGAGGLYQFLPSTWAALGFPGLPQDASVAMQNAAFEKAYAESGTSPWAPYDGCL